MVNKNSSMVVTRVIVFILLFKFPAWYPIVGPTTLDYYRYMVNLFHIR